MARKNTTQVVEAFLDGKPCNPSRSIWTNGNSIWSYSTCIAIRVPEAPERVILNTTRYSVTTTIHQNGLTYLLRYVHGVEVTPTGGYLPRGTSDRDLRRFYLATTQPKETPQP